MEKILKSPKPKLKIDWATHDAAKYACEKWHYSKCMPVNKTVKIGAWEDEKFIGVIIFSPGANMNLFKTYNLSPFQGCELTRVALNKHKTPVSRIMAISLKFLKKNCPQLKLIVSYADTKQGHLGGIYQATNWVYVGLTKPTTNEYFINGKWTHNKSVHDKYGSAGYKKINESSFIKKRKQSPKHKYLMPLDEEIRKQIELLRKPYPKCASSVESGTSDFRSEGGGESPTDALQLKT